VKNFFKARSTDSQGAGLIKQILKPDLPLSADFTLVPGTDPLILVLPDHIPPEKVRDLENTLRKIDGVKIAFVGGSLNEGCSIGIQVLKPLVLSDVLSASNMQMVKHLKKNGERIFLAANNNDGVIANNN
jgi:hypothetical protein